MQPPLVVFLHRPDWDARYQAATLSVTAAALGQPVHLALFFEPLRLWVEGRFDEGARESARAARVAPLTATLDEARRDLGLRLVACETAVRLVGIAPDRAAAMLDGIVSLPFLWRLAKEGQALSL
jgi:peroxiredoxin family protein